jgi:cellulose synthase/poly-beta-1,6-N-acetylglucosamine synthase-like glycosyltransferase
MQDINVLLVIGAVIACLLYFIILLIFYLGWKRVFSFEPKGIDSTDTMISIVVACKNEQKTILSLIGCVAQQSYLNYELILVNDHSTDLTRSVIKNAQTSLPNIVLIDATKHGKKNALKEGILRAKANLIVTTDADCMPSYHWLEAIVTFQNRYPSDLIICPVGLSDKNSLFSRLQALEFSSLVGAAAGSAGAGMPILCNGANLAFEKRMWLKTQNDLHEEEQSGDDMFFLESVKKQGGKIRFLKSEAAFVKTKPPRTLKEFLYQRRRWAGKSKIYTDWQIILTAFVVLAISAFGLIFLVMSYFDPIYLIGYASIFVFKYSIDTRFLYLVRRFFQLDNIWLYALLLSVIYPFYIVFVAITSLVFKPKRWK